MKKYKVNDEIIEAISITDAVKKYKDSIKDEVYVIFRKNGKLMGTFEENYNQRIMNANKIANLSAFSSPQQAIDYLKKYAGGSAYTFKVIDSDYTEVYDEDIDELSVEEQKAIEDYRKAIKGTTDPKLLALYAHILKEEVEHLEELQNAKNGNFEDSMGSEVRAWWKEVERWNTSHGDKYSIDNRGADDEELLAAMFDMLLELKKDSPELYNSGKRIYNKYAMSKLTDSFQPNLGTRFTFEGTGNKEYIVTNTNVKDPYDNKNEHCFEYCELTNSGKQINPRIMRYKTAMADPRLKVL